MFVFAYMKSSLQRVVGISVSTELQLFSVTKVVKEAWVCFDHLLMINNLQFWLPCMLTEKALKPISQSFLFQKGNFVKQTH